MEKHLDGSGYENDEQEQSEPVIRRVRCIFDVDVQIDKNKVVSVDLQVLEHLQQAPELYNLLVAGEAFFDLATDLSKYLEANPKPDADVALGSTDIIMAAALSSSKEIAHHFLEADSRNRGFDACQDILPSFSTAIKPAQILVDNEAVPRNTSHILRRVRKERYLIVGTRSIGIAIIHAVLDRDLFEDWENYGRQQEEVTQQPIDKQGEIPNRIDEAMQDAAENHIEVTRLEVVVWSLDEFIVQSVSSIVNQHCKENYPELILTVYCMNQDGHQEEVTISLL